MVLKKKLQYFIEQYQYDKARLVIGCEKENKIIGLCVRHGAPDDFINLLIDNGYPVDNSDLNSCVKMDVSSIQKLLKFIQPNINNIRYIMQNVIGVNVSKDVTNIIFEKYVYSQNDNQEIRYIIRECIRQNMMFQKNFVKIIQIPSYPFEESDLNKIIDDTIIKKIVKKMDPLQTSTNINKYINWDEINLIPYIIEEFKCGNEDLIRNIMNMNQVDGRATKHSGLNVNNQIATRNNVLKKLISLGVPYKPYKKLLYKSIEVKHYIVHNRTKIKKAQKEFKKQKI